MIVVTNLTQTLVVYIIPVSVFLISCYFLFWHADYKVFWGLNIVLGGSYTVLAFLFPGSNDPPVPKLGLIIFLVFIMPAYVTLCLIMVLSKLEFDRWKI